jgi:hypothetical protein
MKTLASRNGLAIPAPGYLLCLGAWSFPVLRLKRLGLSKACRRLVVTLIRRYAAGIVHLDAFGEVLPGFATFDW